MKDFTIVLTVKEAPRYQLKQYVGEGSLGDSKIEAYTNIPDGSPIIKVDGEYFIVNIHDIIKAVAEHVIDKSQLSSIPEPAPDALAGSARDREG